MRNRPVIPRRPAKAESLVGILDIILRILAVAEALYTLFTGIFSESR